MKKKRGLSFYLGLLTLLLLAGGLMLIGMTCMKFLGPMNETVSKNAVLRLHLDGIIIDGEKFLKNLKKYREDDKVKGVLIVINSPGGVVGPSQEIYQEILRTREEYKLPVVAVAPSLMASGAYYAAVAADKIIVNSGTLMGSIGVIMEFANLKDLYKWAKIERYSIKTGSYKDTGAEYRPMREDEKQFIQGLINEVHMQFKTAVSQGRKMPMEKLELYADGRIMTGATGVRLGLADEVGGLARGEDLIKEMAGLPTDAEFFDPPKPRPNPLDFFMAEEEEGYSKLAKEALKLGGIELNGQPLFLLPSSRFQTGRE